MVPVYRPEAITQFDYVITDSMTVTDFNGKRMRLWMKDETEVGDPEEFMEMLVSRIEKIMGHELLDIYVNPTFLPAELQDRYFDPSYWLEAIDKCGLTPEDMWSPGKD